MLINFLVIVIFLYFLAQGMADQVREYAEKRRKAIQKKRGK
jgi:hypothetical protein